ncbi:MAG: HIT family protein [Candidatus Nanopelagicales bacterium]
MGNPEDWDRLWTPHRLAYIRGEGKPDNDHQGDQCPFCRAPGGADEDNLVVAKGSLVFAVLNKFPYNSGHLLICPYRHVPDYTDLHAAELAEFSVFTQASMVALRSVSAAQGFNIGMNQGSVSGAGISAHLHQHIVPRWGGDTNFMPVVGGTKVLPQLLEQTRELIAAAWPEV